MHGISSTSRPSIKRSLVTPLSPSKTGNLGKRPRSPDSSISSAFDRVEHLKRLKSASTAQPSRSTSSYTESGNRLQQHLQAKAKSLRAPNKDSRDAAAKAKEERRREKEAQEMEWSRKYNAAFHKFRFYFDESLPSSVAKHLKESVLGMHATIEDGFYQKFGITHVITNEDPVPSPSKPVQGTEKENNLGSPFKLRESSTQNLVNQALSFGHKVWSADKLYKILERCGYFDKSSKPSAGKNARRSSTSQPQHQLQDLLENERLFGTTERDPNQRRNDYQYCEKKSYFLLVEDLKEELAPIIFKDYGPSKDPEGKLGKQAWPQLYCEPKARNPFQPWDEREKRRYKKDKMAAKEAARDNEAERQRFVRAAKKRFEMEAAMGGGDLRRTVSLSNMSHRAAEQDALLDLDAESANASGYLPSGNTYVAASGNSVGLTSTTGNTSNRLAGRSLDIPPSLRGRTEVLTSRKFRPAEGSMPPPDFIPEKTGNPTLRKSKSTNTIRLPKRDEGSKPGYCECCRQKFENFDDHVTSNRHRNFARNNDNFMHLDLLLARVTRKTKVDVEREEQRRAAQSVQLTTYNAYPTSEDMDACPSSPEGPVFREPSSEFDPEFGAFLRS